MHTHTHTQETMKKGKTIILKDSRRGNLNQDLKKVTSLLEKTTGVHNTESYCILLFLASSEE